MARHYSKAYPKYKQEAFNKIEKVILGLLKEADFFTMYPWLAEDPRVVLSYKEENFPKERENARGGMVEGFDVSVGGVSILCLRGKDVLSFRNFRKELTEKEYSTVYTNLKVLHQFPGERGTMIESKIGRVVQYDIANHASEFIGQFGGTLREFKRSAR